MCVCEREKERENDQSKKCTKMSTLYDDKDRTSRLPSLFSRLKGPATQCRPIIQAILCLCRVCCWPVGREDAEKKDPRPQGRKAAGEKKAQAMQDPRKGGKKKKVLPMRQSVNTQKTLDLPKSLCSGSRRCLIVYLIFDIVVVVLQNMQAVILGLPDRRINQNSSH